MILTNKIILPINANTTPVTLFNTFGSALFANFAAILANKSVDRTQNTSDAISGIPPIEK